MWVWGWQGSISRISARWVEMMPTLACSYSHRHNTHANHKRVHPDKTTTIDGNLPSLPASTTTHDNPTRQALHSSTPALIAPLHAPAASPASAATPACPCCCVRGYSPCLACPALCVRVVMGWKERGRGDERGLLHLLACGWLMMMIGCCAAKRLKGRPAKMCPGDSQRPLS